MEDVEQGSDVDNWSATFFSRVSAEATWTLSSFLCRVRYEAWRAVRMAPK